MYRELRDGHWLSDKIEDKEIFPVGGYYFGVISEFMRVDADTFQPFLERVAKNQKELEKDKAFKEWFDERHLELDYSLFCHIYAFDLLVRKTFPDATKRASHRVGFYEGKGKRNLSDGVAMGYAACNEFSVLAQLYFQNQKIPTRFVGGELAPHGDFEAAETHSFIVFQNQGKDYVYDPANPVAGKFPRIAVFTGKKDNYFIETKPLFGSDKWYYAGGDEGAFLKYYPKVNLKRTLSKKTLSVKKEKQNG